ncbi:MAG: alpha/beta hydrolase [Candidatus Spyradenecus sp.]
MLPLLLAAALALPSPEAAGFLQALPPGLQARQELAIRQATAGNPAPLERIRAERLKAAKPTPSGNGLRIENGQAAGVPFRCYEPEAVPARATLLYLHGGGWTIGSRDSCDAFCAALARRATLRVISAEYRLAPEHPYPAALDDCQALLAALRPRFPGRWFAAGDSSGGNLALALNRRAPLDALLLYYPVVDATADGSPSWQRYGQGYGLDAGLMEAFNEAYAPEAERRTNPEISPGRCPIDRRLPPTLLIAAECDILTDQGRAFFTAHRAIASPIAYTLIPGSVHLFITVPGQPQARETALARSADFIDLVLELLH